MSGKLIVFEGIDGSGKSTQFKLMCDRLNAESIKYRHVVFPRYDKPSSALIRMYLGGEFGKDPDAVNAYAASSFFAVDRYASFVQDWREYYESGGLIMTDRYTTSNALHQGAKMVQGERERFFKWLYEYEFEYIGLPKPDLTLYMNIDVATAAERLSSRQAKTNTNADIHEQDTRYLESCAQSGLDAAAEYGWQIIDCVKNGKERAIDEIHGEIYEKFTRFKCQMNAEN